MLVFRIEKANGQGIYAGSNLGFICNAQTLARDAGKDAGDRHPGPDNDPLLETWWEGPGKNWSKKKEQWVNGDRRQWICGFQDQQQMLAWFPREGFQLMIQEISKDSIWGPKSDDDMMVSVYEVHGQKVKKGQYQAMFRREDARLVERRPLSDYA
jgi:hypothetical protein